jgi:hypothetical protein
MLIVLVAITGCVCCVESSSHLANGKRHVKFVHMKASEEVGCPICHKNFSRKQVMDRHMKSMHSEHFDVDPHFHN